MGKLIVQEGIDGCGKDAMSDAVEQALRELGHEVIRTTQPSPLPFGALCRDILEGRVERPDEVALQMAFITDRKDHVQRVILPALVRGAYVIMSRYMYSTFAYMYAMLGAEWADIMQDAHDLFQIQRADLAIFLDVPVDVALARCEGKGRKKEIFEQPEVLKLVNFKYHQLLADPRYPEFIRVDNSGTLEEGLEQCMELILRSVAV